MRKYFLPILFPFCLCILLGNKQYPKPVNQKQTAADRAEVVQNPSVQTSVNKQSDNIKKYSAILKKFFVEGTPLQEVNGWKLPFALKNRSDIRGIKFVGQYGDYRASRMAGHRHSGADIVPADVKIPRDVYPAANGVVCFVTQQEPVKTVIIKHKLNDGAIIYTAYIHLKDIFVENGQNVTDNTKIGVLYTKKEALARGGNFDHLHFEVKRRIDDYSCASWLCMSKAELDDYFINPKDFFKTMLK